MAIRAGFLKLSGMPFDCGQIFFFVAFEAQFAALFDQQTFFLRLMSGMTGSTISVSNGVMLESGFG
jgi:hypothetical protein